jgi:hypothetical protein
MPISVCGWAVQEYMASREGLRVIFHLVDSRHGPLDQDLATMEAMEVSVFGLRQASGGNLFLFEAMEVFRVDRPVAT